MSVIDCHQHFWTFGKRVHKFPPAVGTRLDRDFTPEDLRPQLKKAGVDRTILVQVLNELDETHEFLDMQREIDFVAGVVGWVPLTDPAACARELESIWQPVVSAIAATAAKPRVRTFFISLISFFC